MLTNYKNSLELLIHSQDLQLYYKLINQLNKDFKLTNINVNFSNNENPKELKKSLLLSIETLIKNDFIKFTNLLYTIDINENDAKNYQHLNLNEYSEKVVFLILKRILQKVWFKHHYSK